MNYDYLIVGAGLFGSTVARVLKDKGKKVLIIDKRNHIGGNCYTEKQEGITIHKYGAHIFHTNNDDVWQFINKYGSFNNYQHKVIVNYKNNLYSFPINLMTLYQIFGVNNPIDAQKTLDNLKESIINPKNAEEIALSLIGKELYEIFIKGYTEKQWMKKAIDLPAFIIKRLPIRYNFDDTYFNNAKYQGMPVDGYTSIFKKLIKDIDFKLNADYLLDKDYFNKCAKKIIFTGQVDAFYNYRFGELEYRPLRFENKVLDVEDYQGVSVMNFTDESIPYTRIIEHKHFEPNNKTDKTIITYEYPEEWSKEKIPYYPLNIEPNISIYNKYKELADKDNVIFGGRLAEYKYYDMDKTIESALELCKKLLKND
jgi:UDP-galactopyranose mutase